MIKYCALPVVLHPHIANSEKIYSIKSHEEEQLFNFTCERTSVYCYSLNISQIYAYFDTFNPNLKGI